MDEYRIHLDRHVLRQLGSQLYGDTPSVIAELVANSYDADAKNVWITVDTKSNTLSVEDDGKGMTAADINNSFLNIGYDKREGNNTTASGRKIMGRKGIGKLAAFSLTNQVIVASSKENKKCGCILDFKRIVDGEEPEALEPENIIFSSDRLSPEGTGTRIELVGVKKRVALSYRFIVNKLIRTFDVNDEDFTVHIRRQNSAFVQLRRAELDFFSIMDTILTIGNEHASKIDLVRKNNIPEKYKHIITYNEFLSLQKGKNKLQAFPYEIEVEDTDGNEVKANFTLNGWIGTVSALPELRGLTEALIASDDEEEDKVTISDNRISLYSRGKLGEYDILAKVKNNRNSEAYVIGELFVDIFEDDNLTDMAISNRRGYEEGDPRYTETIKIVKRLLGYIVGQKDLVSKKRKDDENQEEINKIKEDLSHRSRSREIFERSLSAEERNVVQEENMQFTRTITSDKSTKKIFISHNSKLKIYGQFIVDVLEAYGIDVRSDVIYTSDRRLGVPQGRDIYDYLKECFREELMVVFLFSKAFYDSNVCISEAGAAWATNQNCLNVVIDIGFNDIEKPSNNALSSIKLSNLHDEEQRITLEEFFSTIISTGLHQPVDMDKLKDSIQKMIDGEKYCDAKMDHPDLFVPTRKFLPAPNCPKCKNPMRIIRNGEDLLFQCINVSCKEELPLSIE